MSNKIDLSMLPEKLPACWREFYKKVFELAAKVDAIRAGKAAEELRDHQERASMEAEVVKNE